MQTFPRIIRAIPAALLLAAVGPFAVLTQAQPANTGVEPFFEVTVQAAPPQPPEPPPRSRFVFSLLPRTLQLRPKLDFNIITTLTEAGRSVMPPTREEPTYFVAEPGVNRNVGVGGEIGLKTPPPEALQRMIEQALAENGYLPVKDSVHPPSLVIFFHWGTSSFSPTEFDTEIDQRRTLLDRAMLLAGDDFADEISRAMEELDARTHYPPEMAAMLPNPIEMIRNRSVERARLVEELFSSSYYVVASAFDHAAMAEGRGVLLWRTKMTVNSLGVNMAESLPPLIASAAPYFGRDMPEPVVVSQRVSRAGRVEVGELTVIEDAGESPATEPAPEAADQPEAAE